MRKFIALCLLSQVCVFPGQALESLPDLSVESLNSSFLATPVRLEDLDGAAIVLLSQKKNSMPLLYPREHSLLHWMDTGDRNLLTLKDFLEDPTLFTKPEPFLGKNLFIKENTNADASVSQKTKAQPSRWGSSELVPLGPEKVLADDRELRAFLENNEDDLSLEPEQTAPSPEAVTSVSPPTNHLASPLPRARLPARNAQGEFTDPEMLEEYQRRIQTSTLGRIMEKRGNSREGLLSSSLDAAAVLKLKASKPTPDGKVMPAQASDFYLTTRDLRELLKHMDVDRELAGETKSVAEIWAHAEKNLDTDPEVALSVKSVLLQAKVGRTRTNPFGEASLSGLPPDDKYFLIGIDKDEKTNVVTIWSKEVEVNPGENVVELSSSDVIYQD